MSSGEEVLGKGSLQRGFLASSGPVVVGIATLVHLGIAVLLDAVASADVDEMYTLSSSSASLWAAGMRALSFEQQPPLYFVLVSLWREIHPGLFWTRLFSTVCTTAAIVIAASLPGRWSTRLERSGSLDPVLAVALAVNPFLVWASFNARGYALAILLSALVLRLGADALLQRHPGSGRLAAFTVVAILGLHVQYYFGFLLVAIGVAAGLLAGPRALFRFGAAMAVAGLCLLPLLRYSAEHLETHAVAGGALTGPGGLEEMARRVESLVLSMHRVSLGRGMRWAARLLFWGLVGLSLVLAVRSSRSLRPVLTSAVLVAVTAVPLAVIWDLVGSPVVQFRHTAVLLVPSMVFAMTLLGASGGAIPRMGGLLVQLAMSLNALWTDYHDLDRNPAHKAVVAFLEDHPRLHPAQPVFVFPSDSVLSLRYHFSGANRFEGIPSEPSLTRYDPWAFVLRDVDSVRRRLEAFPSPDGCAWLVVYADRDILGIDLRGHLLDVVVQRDFRVEGVGVFEDCTVRLICRQTSVEGRHPS